MEFDPQSDETTGYHLFLMPTGSVAEELQQTINQLAEEYDGPIFPPHVTLLARIAEGDETVVIQKARTLASGMQPVSFSLGELQSEDSYFKALYSVVREQEEMRLMYEKACAIFGRVPEPSYQAHLSLLYGNYPEVRKAQTRMSLPVPRGPFTIDTLHVYRTQGEVGKWTEIGVIPFA